ncbi:MAG: hypothetical protein ACE149_09610 [Armatimonadota bacterium]
MNARLGRGIAALVLVSVAALLAQAVPATAAPPVAYARISFAQDKNAVVYLSFSNNRMRAASTIEGLKAAQPVRAASGNLERIGRREYMQWYEFPETALPVTLSGYSNVTCNLNYHRSGTRAGESSRGRGESIYIYGRVTLSRKGRSGDTWGYSLNLNGEERQSGKYDADHPFRLTVPALATEPLTFEITAQVEQRDARIGMQVKSGKTDIYTVLKDGKGAPVTLEVLDKDRKVVKSETGDPVKFGFT